VEPEAIRSRLEAIVKDFESRASKDDGLVPAETISVVNALLVAAKEAVPDDIVVQAVSIPQRAKYSDLSPTLRQVTLALPMFIGMG